MLLFVNKFVNLRYSNDCKYRKIIVNSFLWRQDIKILWTNGPIQFPPLMMRGVIQVHTR
jgi:hypothetical protein